WNLERLGTPEKIGPNLRLNQYDGLGMNREERARDIAAPDKRIVDLLNVRGQFALQLPHAGGGGGRNDDFHVRQPRFERSDTLRRDVDLADAHGMDPKHMAICDRLLDLGAEAAKSLAKTLHPAAPPP